MDRASADDDAALADPPSTSGAHWANRENDALYRRPGGQTSFRRPVNSFPGEEAAARERPAAGFQPSEAIEDRSWYDTGARASFGVTAGPISRSGRLAAAPTSPAAAPMSPVGTPMSPAGFMSPVRGRPGHGFGELAEEPNPELRPHRAVRRPPLEPAPPWDPPQPARPARRFRTVMIAFALTVIVLLAGAAAAFTLLPGSNRSLESVLRLGRGAGARTATAALGGRTAAGFELLAATTNVTVKAQDLGGDLYRITSAEGSGTVPGPVLAGNRVQLHLIPEGAGATGKVAVVLSSKVKWTLRLIGGADEQVVDLRGGRIGSIDLLGAARRVELALPAPSGTVSVRITGAVEDMSITAPPDVPIRLRLDSGAKTVATGERTLRDVEPGSKVTPPGWQARNRYDVHAEARVARLVVAAAP